ncbi:hypothetical protein BDF14DRAFT_1722931 [Spinellus fusiger]|nr:hypothetical protein BDF14DRAFT_1722931 [Spinellus fusiger]
MTPTLVPVATPLASHTEKKLPNHLPPVITEQTQPGSVGVFTVVSSYTPTLSDELDIEVGDRIEIFSIYDDGWCQGINLTSGSSKGVFPKHCTDYASATIHDKTMSVVSMDLGKGKRVSSMYIKKPL